MSSDIFNQTECRTNQTEKKETHDIGGEPRNGYLSVTPSKLEFTFDLDNFLTQSKIIDVSNYFSKPCYIQLLPLESHYFQIRHTPQRKCLNPGSVFNIHVFFTPNKNRDYNDNLRIRYTGGELIQIKLHAKVVTKFCFPTNVNFGNVPLGRTVYYEIPIHSHSENELSFAILPCKTVSCLDIYPRWGRIAPRQKPVTVMLIYRPVRYVNMHFQIHIYIYDFQKEPYVINFYARTRPGLLRESLECVSPKIRSKTHRGKINVTSLKIATKEKDIRKEKSSSKDRASKSINYETILLEQCGYFPPNTLHGVNCVLNSKTRKLFNEHELKGPLGAYAIKSIAQRSEKLMEFLIKVECHHWENEQAKFHNKPRLNQTIHNMSEDKLMEVRMQHHHAWDDYKRLIMHSGDDVFQELSVIKARQRILRPSQKVGIQRFVLRGNVLFKHPTITSTRTQTKEPRSRYCAIYFFIQAARKIILKNRLLNVLAKLRGLTMESIDQYRGSTSVMGDHLSMLQL